MYYLDPGLLPDPFLLFLQQHILRRDAPVQLLRRRAAAHAETGLNVAYRLLEPAMDRVTRALYDSPDIVVLGFVLVVAFVALQLMIWIKRVMMWWTRMVFRVFLWACIVGVIAVIWQRGVEASLRDAVVIASKIAGYAAVLKEVWIREYQKYDAQAQAGRRPNMAAPRGRGGSR